MIRHESERVGVPQSRGAASARAFNVLRARPAQGSLLARAAIVPPHTAVVSASADRLHRVSDGARVSGPEERPARRSRLGILAALVLAAITVIGARYYLAPIAERVRSPWHPWLKPSGYVGQAAGILSLAIFLSLWLYPLRRRFRWLAFTGSMARWLNVHVALALVLPLLAAVHASWRFSGLIGLGYASMLAVWLSGLVGRYLYARIPRGRTGLELTAEDVSRSRHALLAEIARRARLPLPEVQAVLGEDPWPCEGLGLLATLRQLVRDDLARWRATRALVRMCRRRPGVKLDRHTLRRVRKLARREMGLMQQARLLGATQRVFRFWHVIHRPFAVAALVAVLVHVGVAVVVGATWLW